MNTNEISKLDTFSNKCTACCYDYEANYVEELFREFSTRSIELCECCFIKCINFHSVQSLIDSNTTSLRGEIESIHQVLRNQKKEKKEIVIKDGIENECKLRTLLSKAYTTIKENALKYQDESIRFLEIHRIDVQTIDELKTKEKMQEKLIQKLQCQIRNENEIKVTSRLSNGTQTQTECVNEIKIQKKPSVRSLSTQTKYNKTVNSTSNMQKHRKKPRHKPPKRMPERNTIFMKDLEEKLLSPMEKLKMGTIKIVNIPEELIDSRSLITELKRNNDILREESIWVKQNYSVLKSDGKVRNAIIVVSLHTQEELCKRKGINFDDRISTCYLHDEILQCLKCWEFGHHSSVCPNNVVCKKCSGPHWSGLCRNGHETRNCINCIEKGYTDHFHTATYDGCRIRKDYVKDHRSITRKFDMIDRKSIVKTSLHAK